MLGLRHAVDADHIAAIDNVVRKLMQEGKRPFSVGLFFSLGHSLAVALAVAAIAATAFVLEGRFHRIQIDRQHHRHRRVGVFPARDRRHQYRDSARRLAELSPGAPRRAGRRARARPSALRPRLARPPVPPAVPHGVAKLADVSGRLLFGLGFDTATEISLFTVAASQASGGMTFGTIMIFPALFTAGMTLVDTTDSVLMVGAYGWAFLNPIRKIWYNLTITAISVVVALADRRPRGAGADRRQAGSRRRLLGRDRRLDRGLANFGYLVIGVFIACWAISYFIYRWHRLISR